MPTYCCHAMATVTWGCPAAIDNSYHQHALNLIKFVDHAPGAEALTSPAGCAMTNSREGPGSRADAS